MWWLNARLSRHFAYDRYIHATRRPPAVIKVLYICRPPSSGPPQALSLKPHSRLCTLFEGIVTPHDLRELLYSGHSSNLLRMCRRYVDYLSYLIYVLYTKLLH